MAGVRPVTLAGLLAALEIAPAMCEVPDRLSLLYLPRSVRLVEAIGDLVAELDGLQPQAPGAILCPHLDPMQVGRIPALRLEHEPFGTGLNAVLATRYDEVAAHLLLQSKVAAHIADRVEAVRPDCVIWLIVDGLAYGDVVRHAPNWLSRARPVLVDGISTTSRGMPRLVGIPRLVSRLLGQGYVHAHGFTYWTREGNDLTDMLFNGFGRNVHASPSIAGVVSDLQRLDLDRTFVQVIRDGTDHVAHEWRDTPPVRALVQGCFDQLERLADVVRSAGRSGLLFLSTDHGMLWREEHELVTVPEPGQPRPRYHEATRIGERLFTFPGVEGTGSALQYPYVRRSLRANEWGVHGGLSYEESVIPLVELAV
jgi:hypothetical protein